MPHPSSYKPSEITRIPFNELHELTPTTKQVLSAFIYYLEAKSEEQKIYELAFLIHCTQSAGMPKICTSIRLNPPLFYCGSTLFDSHSKRGLTLPGTPDQGPRAILIAAEYLGFALKPCPFQNVTKYVFLNQQATIFRLVSPI